MKENRLVRAKKLKKLAAAGRENLILFTDEKIFTVEPHHNSQNDRQLLPKGSAFKQHPAFVTRSHYPESVMVWGGICATGKTPLVFIDRGVKINAQVYQRQVLRDVVLPWSQKHFGKAEWYFQQDWAPAHGAKTTLDLCKRLFYSSLGKDIWPSNSPDLNPMDFSVCGILESRLPASRRCSVESLKANLNKVSDEISEKELAGIVKNFKKRLSACISENGGHFEHLL